MPSLTNWGDLFKFQKETLDDDYNQAQNLAVKAKATSAQKGALTVNFKNNNKGSTGDVTLKNNITKDYEVETKFTAHGLIDADNTLDLGNLADV